MNTQTSEEKTQQKEEEEEGSSNHVVLSSDDEESTPYNDKQIVLYEPTANQHVDPIRSTPAAAAAAAAAAAPQRVIPSVGAFTVQCAVCFKWRLIPTKEKYEEIREHIMVKPFTCDVAKQWRPEVTCDAPGDIQQDNTRLWAIDKPSISQPPPGWERELRIRGEGSSKFADVYYMSPYGKRLRSMIEVQKYLSDHPEFIAEGVTLSQFSFQIPKPLQENYVRKRTHRVTTPGESDMGMPKFLKTIEASPLSWAAPDERTNVLLAGADDITPPAKKKAKSSVYQHSPHKVKIKGPKPPPNGVYEV